MEQKVWLMTSRPLFPNLYTFLVAHPGVGKTRTINEGKHYMEFSVQVDLSRSDLPVARVRYELARLGATHIETIPLNSCIPSLNVINL